MMRQNRRGFLRLTAATIAAVPTVEMAKVALRGSDAPPDPSPMRLGLIVWVGKDPEAAIQKVHDLGLPTCQVGVGSLDAAIGERLRAALDRHGIEATSMVPGLPGPEVYDFYQGPLTIGLVPRAWREKRVQTLVQASDFAKKFGIPAVQTHCGFIPEDPSNPLYLETLAAIREVARYCKQNGQNFRYETGQETPTTLLRAIEDVGLDNQGVNFDCANFVLYGKANPVDALEILGPYVQGIHAKDGLFPTNPRSLGKEVAIGKGKVDFPRIIQRLKELHYQGAITIEREISGAQQLEDVRKEKAYLEGLIG